MNLARVRLVVATFGLAALLGAAGACNKPSEESCRHALANMRRLLGTDTVTRAEGANAADIRRCRGGSSKKSVECAAKATTVDELRKCNLVKIPEGPVAPPPAAK